MVTVERARPGAKAFARLFGSDAAKALEALTGRAPTPAELVVLGGAAARRTTRRGRCPLRPVAAPSARAASFHRAGRMVADAALAQRRTLRFPDACDISEPTESRRDRLTRCAGIVLSGCAAESHATGSTAHHQPAVLIAAYSAFVVGDGRTDDLNRAAMDFEWCASLALRHNWTAVEKVEARLHVGQCADDILIHVVRTPANDARPSHSPIRAVLDGHLRSIGDAVADLANALSRVGGRAR